MLSDRLRSSAKAFRENTVYTSDGDPVRLGVQADECDKAADALDAKDAAIAELATLLRQARADQQSQGVIRELVHVASDLLRHVDWLTCGLPQMLEDAALTDEEGLIGAAVDAANSARALIAKHGGEGQ